MVKYLRAFNSRAKAVQVLLKSQETNRSKETDDTLIQVRRRS